MEDIETLKREIKEIIYGCAKKGGMCEDFVDGQIIGLRTGIGLEFDAVTIGISEWYVDRMLKKMNEIKSLLPTHKETE